MRKPLLAAPAVAMLILTATTSTLIQIVARTSPRLSRYTAAAQHRLQLLLEDRLDETAHPLPDPVFQRVKRATAGQ